MTCPVQGLSPFLSLKQPETLDSESEFRSQREPHTKPGTKPSMDRSYSVLLSLRLRLCNVAPKGQG